MFSLPKEANSYLKDVILKCQTFLEFGIWHGIELTQFKIWLNNFKTEEEKYFIACILDKLIYRSNDQTKSLLNQLIQRTLPDFFRIKKTVLSNSTFDFEDLINKNNLATKKFKFVVAIRKKDIPTKSAHVIARFLKQRKDFDETLIIKPWDVFFEIKQGTNIFIFVDDFLGTGEQFSHMLTEERITTIIKPENTIIYAPLVAHKSGIDYLTSSFPNIFITPIEELDNRYDVFDPSSDCFKDGVNDYKTAKDFYYQLLKSRNINCDDRKGFGNLSLTYSFEHATPDNNLPILWWPNTPGFTPLFLR